VRRQFYWPANASLRERMWHAEIGVRGGRNTAWRWRKFTIIQSPSRPLVPTITGVSPTTALPSGAVIGVGTPSLSPTIVAFSPTSGAVGAPVTISGTGFVGATGVAFNGVAATYKVASATQISTAVPAGATSGSISVTTPGGTAASASNFTVMPPAPMVTGFSPASGAVGTAVAVSGTSFTGATAVAFSGTAASYTVVSATQISAAVPAGATGGPISVTTPGGVATSASSFMVTANPPRSITSGAFQAQWSLTDPEEISSFSWNGSQNLTNSWTNAGQCPSNPDLEFFGNAWGLGGAGVHPVLVGGGTSGTWNSQISPGSTAVNIASAANGCAPQTSGVPVATAYQFPSSGNAFTVQRTFSFGTTAFASDLRPYIPRLFPENQYTNVYYPATNGTLAQANEGSCDAGCEFTNWNGSWFAITNWATGHGLIVKRTSAPASVALWVDQDGGSATSATSVLLLQPPGGFTGTVTESESLCFYNNWVPSLTLPAGC
jgi:IPT/TIG domain